MTMSQTSMERQKVVGWARVYLSLTRTVAKTLRRGAWYPVVNNDKPDRVTLLMGSRGVDVPRMLLEIRRDRPKHFSVVTRVEYSREPGRPSVHQLGKTYVVCPVCGHRFALFGRPESRDCPECRHHGDVGWWEA